MKKVLFMPFLQIPSGHHQVADALSNIIHEINPSIACEKVDILQYSYGSIEAFISQTYLKWIHFSPKTYNWIYQASVLSQQKERQKDYKLYEILFKSYVNKLIAEKKPDLIICSHALPSYMLSKLKQNSELSIPVINVYTDYFIHDFWGVNKIDFHFVSHLSMKEFLLKRGVAKDKIFVTGIPTHPTLTQPKSRHSHEELTICTIMGGSLGVGVIEDLIPKLLPSKNLTFLVVCGKNKKLYDKLLNLNHPRIKPLPYITKREEMNDIYSKSDIVVTKPGGVTISECLMKRVPILIYHALPGQEQINLAHLREMGLAFHLTNWEKLDCLESELKRLSKEQDIFNQFNNAITHYHKQLTKQPIKQILNNILLAI